MHEWFVSKWINLIHTTLNFLFKWSEREFIRTTLPGTFKRKCKFHRLTSIIDCVEILTTQPGTFKCKFPRLTSIIEGFEILIERPKILKARANCYSNYKKHSACVHLNLICCTPNGFVSFHFRA